MREGALPTLNQQVEIFGKYLLKKPMPEMAFRLYDNVVAMQTYSLSSADQRTLTLACKHPSCIGFLDSYFAFFRPTADLRNRLYVMFSILETVPEFSRYFLARKRSPWYIVWIFLVGVRSVYRLFIGYLIVKIARL